MAAIAFDTLKAARHLIEAGVPTRQAEAQVELMAEAFVFNIDSLVTRDYLDARLDGLVAKQDAKLDASFAEVDVKFTKIDGNFRLVYWMLTVVILSTTIPAIRMWLAA